MPTAIDTDNILEQKFLISNLEKRIYNFRARLTSLSKYISREEYISYLKIQIVIMKMLFIIHAYISNFLKYGTTSIPEITKILSK